jgi:hypothetical protein
VEHAVIVDVEPSTAVRQAEVTAAKTMIERTHNRFELWPERLIADTGYASAEMLNWLVNDRGIEPHIPVFDKSKRTDDTFSREDFVYDHASDSYRCPAGKTLCKSAPKWDPARIRNKPLIYRLYLPGDGVPIGADWDPTRPSFSNSIPSTCAESALGPRSMLIHSLSAMRGSAPYGQTLDVQVEPSGCPWQYRRPTPAVLPRLGHPLIRRGVVRNGGAVSWDVTGIGHRRVRLTHHWREPDWNLRFLDALARPARPP